MKAPLIDRTAVAIAFGLLLLVASVAGASEPLPPDAWDGAARDVGAAKSAISDYQSASKSTLRKLLGILCARKADGPNQWASECSTVMGKLKAAESAYAACFDDPGDQPASMSPKGGGWFASEKEAWNRFNGVGQMFKRLSDQLVKETDKLEGELNSIPGRLKVYKSKISIADRWFDAMAKIGTVLPNEVGEVCRFYTSIRSAMKQSHDTRGVLELVANLFDKDRAAIIQFRLVVEKHAEDFKKFIDNFGQRKLDPDGAGVFYLTEKGMKEEMNKVLALYIRTSERYFQLIEPWVADNMLDGTTLDRAGFTADNINEADEEVLERLGKLAKQLEQKRDQWLRDAEAAFQKQETVVGKIVREYTALEDDYDDLENEWKEAEKAADDALDAGESANKVLRLQQKADKLKEKMDRLQERINELKEDEEDEQKTADELKEKWDEGARDFRRAFGR